MNDLLLLTQLQHSCERKCFREYEFRWNETNELQYIYSQCSNMESLQIEFIVVFIVLIYHNSVSLRYSHYSAQYVNSITKYN